MDLMITCYPTPTPSYATVDEVQTANGYNANGYNTLGKVPAQ